MEIRFFFLVGLICVLVFRRLFTFRKVAVKILFATIKLILNNFDYYTVQFCLISAVISIELDRHIYLGALSASGTRYPSCGRLGPRVRSLQACWPCKFLALLIVSGGSFRFTWACESSRSAVARRGPSLGIRVGPDLITVSVVSSRESGQRFSAGPAAGGLPPPPRAACRRRPHLSLISEHGQ